MSNEVEPNLTLFFRPFLNTSEGMDADLGFSGTSQKCVGFDRSEPQIVVHVGVWCQVHYEKGSEKESHARLLAVVNKMARYEEQVNGMFLKRRQFGPGTGQWKGRNPQRPESWTTEGA